MKFQLKIPLLMLALMPLFFSCEKEVAEPTVEEEVLEPRKTPDADEQKITVNLSTVVYKDQTYDAQNTTAEGEELQDKFAVVNIINLDDYVRLYRAIATHSTDPMTVNSTMHVFDTDEEAQVFLEEHKKQVKKIEDKYVGSNENARVLWGRASWNAHVNLYRDYYRQGHRIYQWVASSGIRSFTYNINGWFNNNTSSTYVDMLHPTWHLYDAPMQSLHSSDGGLILYDYPNAGGNWYKRVFRQNLLTQVNQRHRYATEIVPARMNDKTNSFTFKIY